MKRNQYVVVGSLLLALTACQKIITPDLNPGEPTVVIEGTVTNQPGPYTVRISRSADFYQPGTPAGITGAAVILTDDRGHADTLTDAGNGLYRTTTTRGTVGRTYVLRVRVGAVAYQASSTMPPVVPLDGLTTESRSVGRIVYANFTDPANVANYYRWKLFLNDQPQRGIFVASDRLNNGLRTRQALFAGPNTGTSIERGDRVRVEMQCIDARGFDYFFALAQVSGAGNNQAATPANPTTNLSNGALGYFSAYSVTTESLVVQ